MLDAYVGTIDYEGENLQDAHDEIQSYFEEMSPLFEHSFGVVINGEMASAVLVCLVRGQPFIAYVMTRASDRGGGLGRRVAEEALNSLARAGYGRVAFYITKGNTPSEALFGGLGAEPMAAD